jgi:hypothetical protein
MIVRNEAKLIRRCLESVRKLVDFVCISDTGSTDETKPIIRAFLAEYNIPGVIADNPWQDFATNRNLALASLWKNSGIDYAFMIDADDQLEIAPSFDIDGLKAGMDKDLYDVTVSHGNIIHARPQIFRNKPEYHWVGVLHEYLQAPPLSSRAAAPGLVIKASIEGSRGSDPLKYAKDAEILENALKTEKNEYLRNRYTFYLAQSYRDANEPEKARVHYGKRSKMGGWDQEVYVSCLEAIRCSSKIGGEFEFDAAKTYFARAAVAVPERAEAHHAMAFLCRQLGKNKEGMTIARGRLRTPTPNGLFVEPWIYDFGLQDEFAVNAYWCEHYLDCLEACLMLLANPKTPHDTVKRLADNAIASLNKLRPRFTSNTSLVFSD